MDAGTVTCSTRSRERKEWREEKENVLQNERSDGAADKPLAPDGRGKYFFDIDLGGIVARIAGRAISRLFTISASFFQAFQREIGERVGHNEVANLIDTLVRGHEFSF